jgi:putative heme iron utilization protein
MNNNYSSEKFFQNDLQFSIYVENCQNVFRNIARMKKEEDAWPQKIMNESDKFYSNNVNDGDKKFLDFYKQKYIS